MAYLCDVLNEFGERCVQLLLDFALSRNTLETQGDLIMSNSYPNGAESYRIANNIEVVGERSSVRDALETCRELFVAFTKSARLAQFV